MKFIIIDEEGNNYEFVELSDTGTEDTNRKVLEEHVEAFCDNMPANIENVVVYSVHSTYRASKKVSIKKVSVEK